MLDYMEAKMQVKSLEIQRQELVDLLNQIRLSGVLTDPQILQVMLLFKKLGIKESDL